MRIVHQTLKSCKKDGAAVIVIDVMRAFSTAAYAFSRGAERIILTGTVEEALSLKIQHPGSRAMGEVGGLLVPGFDYWNSPYEISKEDLQGLTLIQRTSSGTQGVIHCKGAKVLMTGSFLIAEAMLSYLKKCDLDEIALVSTGVRDGMRGVEDIALAEYLEDRLHGKSVSPEIYLKKAQAWRADSYISDPETISALNKDKELSLQADVFDFIMLVKEESGLPVLRPYRIDELFCD